MPYSGATVTALFRHPVKGLSPEPLEQVELKAGAYFPEDRLYAVENGPSGYDPSAPAFRPKTAYLMLMRHARLAALHSRYDSASATLVLARNGVEVVRGQLTTPEGCRAIEDFLTGYMGLDAAGPLRILAAPPQGFRFMDSAKHGFVSLLNLATVRALGEEMGAQPDPLRFRMNIHLDGWPANAELDLVGRQIRLGQARLTLLKRTVRCPATQVNPQTAARDMDIQQALRTAWGHMDCGVYARVDEGGMVRPGDPIILEPARRTEDSGSN
ncbi:MOSC domain-containing protein [Xanthobacter sp. TB0139]|uniref:MOSC domain-containing protein n=1 Tax=Xanthobacter sp. TB0139 TaxID=3459178 RepID=UPI004039B594